MAPTYGTLSLIDSLESYNAANVSVLQAGEETVNGYVTQILAAYNSQVAEMLGDLVGVVPSRETTYGVNTTTGDMVDLDEFGVSDAMKFPFTPAKVGFPLRRKGAALQWTRDFLARTTPAELARQVLGLTEADTRALRAAVLRALLTPTNNTSYVDRLTDGSTLALRALVNADSEAIPPQLVTNATFDASTHTHYLATASLVEANAVSLEDTVFEHWDVNDGGILRVYINKAQEATWRAFAGFNAYTDPRVIYATDANRADASVDILRIQDREIGFHNAAVVSVKPWVPASYAIAFIDGGGGQPVVGWRRPEGALADTGDLRIVADLDRHPLHARAYERMYGFSIWNRTRAAVLYSGGGSYTAPTL